MSGATQTETDLRHVVDDLQRIFGGRLEAVVGYGGRSAGRVPEPGARAPT